MTSSKRRIYVDPSRREEPTSSAPKRRIVVDTQHSVQLPDSPKLTAVYSMPWTEFFLPLNSSLPTLFSHRPKISFIDFQFPKYLPELQKWSKLCVGQMTHLRFCNLANFFANLSTGRNPLFELEYVRLLSEWVLNLLFQNYQNVVLRVRDTSNDWDLVWGWSLHVAVAAVCGLVKSSGFVFDSC